MRVKTCMEPYLYLLPAVVLMLMLLLYPIFVTFQMAFYTTDSAGRLQHYVGLENFREVVRDPQFWAAFRRTLYWTTVVVLATVLISLVLALLLNYRFPGRGVVRAAILLPWAASLSISSVVWRWMCNADYGAINNLLRSLGFSGLRVEWLARPETAFPMMIVVAIWCSIPFTTVTLLAGLQSIPRDLYEAATVDGATEFQQFRWVTLPLLRDVLAVVILINLIYVFNSYPIIWTMTQGGPANTTDTIVTYLYKLAFWYHRFGQAAAMALVSFLFLIGVSTLYTIIFYRRQAYV